MSQLPLHFALMLTASMLGACQGGEAGVVEEGSVDNELRVCASGSKVAGIDVSYDQGVINWTNVAAVNKGDKAFAFIRVGDGWFHDPKFVTNWAGAEAAGMYRGAYQYFRASQDPIAQAELLLNAIGRQLGPTDLPPVLDLETKDGVSTATVNAHVQKWLAHVKSVLGRAPMVYTNVGFSAEIGNPSALGASPLWVANWTTACPSIPSEFKSGWKFWQNATFTKTTVSGITGGIDLDYFNGSMSDLAAYAGPNGQ